MFPLRLARMCHWTNNRVAGDLQQYDAHGGHCNNNASIRDFSFTNNFVPNLNVWIFLLLSVMACCWANCQADGDFGRHGAHVESLQWQCCKTRFRYYKWFLPQLKCLDITFALSHGMLLSKLSSGWWFRTPSCSCVVTVMAILQNAISQTADSGFGMGNLIRSGMIYYNWLRF